MTLQLSLIHISTPYFQISECHFKQVDGIMAEATITCGDKSTIVDANGNGRLDAVSNTIKQFFGISYQLSTYEEHALTQGSSSKAIAYVSITCQGDVFWLSLIHIFKGWEDMVNSIKNLNKEVTVALVGKYTALHDAYISVVESLKHGGFAHNAQVNIKWVNRCV